jgi:hypothetical protein
MSGRGLGRGIFFCKSIGPSIDPEETATRVSSSDNKSDSTKKEPKKDSGLGTGSGGRGVTLDSGGGSSGRGSASVGRGLLAIARGLRVGSGDAGAGRGDITLATTHSSDKDKETGPAQPPAPERKLTVGGRGLPFGFAARMQSMRLETPEVPMIPQSPLEMPKTSGSQAKSTSSDRTVSTTHPNIEIEPVLKHGKDGEPVETITNFIRLESQPDTGIYEYEVRFEPQVRRVSNIILKFIVKNLFIQIKF